MNQQLVAKTYLFKSMFVLYIMKYKINENKNNMLWVKLAQIYQGKLA